MCICIYSVGLYIRDFEQCYVIVRFICLYYGIFHRFDPINTQIRFGTQNIYSSLFAFFCFRCCLCLLLYASAQVYYLSEFYSIFFIVLLRLYFDIILLLFFWIFVQLVVGTKSVDSILFDVFSLLFLDVLFQQCFDSQ